MAESICNCHCGTRIDLDEQLLEQRETWKEKYYCLQKQCKADVQLLKENIYAECANIMQQEFSGKEAEQNRITNQKNSEIKDLVSRVISLETEVKVTNKEKQLNLQKFHELEAELSEKDDLINMLKSKSSKGMREWELKHQQELASLRKRLSASNKEIIDKLELQCEHLRHKVKEFEAKYQKIIPEVQKMKNLLNSKTVQIEELQANLQRIRKDHIETQTALKDELNDLQRIHSTCQRQIKSMEENNEDLNRQIEKCRKISREVKVEAVYVDRPVQVEKVVQKIVEVEKVVKKYIDNPNSENMLQLQEENKRLKIQLNNVLGEIKEMEDYYRKIVEEMEESIKCHEQNVISYKKQRQELAHRVTEQKQEIELLENFIERMGNKSSKPHEPEKIVVHVKKDGTYEKTVEKAVPKKKK